VSPPRRKPTTVSLPFPVEHIDRLLDTAWAGLDNHGDTTPDELRFLAALLEAKERINA
jgi:hypothetical protein